MRRLFPLLIGLALLPAAAGPASAAPALDGTFPINGTPTRLATGPDGNVWFTLSPKAPNTKTFGKITPDGTVTEYDSPNNLTPIGITTGPDGNIWMTAAVKVIRADPANPSGATSFDAPDIAQAQDIVAGPDGHLWTGSANTVVEITPSATPTETPHAGLISGARGITVGGDNNLWIADFGGAAIVKFSTSATLLKTAAVGGGPQQITAGPSGQLGFTNPGASPEAIGRIDFGGNFEQTPFTTPPDPFGIVFANDGAYWIAEFNADKLGRFTPDGVHTQPIDLGSKAQPRFLAKGANDTLWVGLEENQSGDGKIARITGVTAPPPPTTTTPPPPGTTPPVQIANPLVFAGIKLQFLVFTVSGKFVTIPVPCPAGLPGNCAGTITLRTAARVLPPKLAAAKKRKKKILKLGSARFSVPSGTAAKVKVKLSKTALKLIAKKRKVKAVATITATAGGTTKTTKPTITLKAAKKKKKRR